MRWFREAERNGEQFLRLWVIGSKKQGLFTVDLTRIGGSECVLDWAATLRKEGERSGILRSDDLARRYGILEGAVGNALRRQERRGLVEHVSNKVYINKLAHDFSSRELVGVLRPKAYISLESALAEWGISRQSPSSLTCVTTGFPRKFRTASVRITYWHIGEQLYWGFREKRTRHGSLIVVGIQPEALS